MTDHGFARTECACPDCVACCRRQPGPLAPGDLERISEHLYGSAIMLSLHLFWASPGAVVMNTATRELAMVGTITPRLDGGRCVFLQADDRCAVHEVAPFGCAYLDMHMPEPVAQARVVWLYQTIMHDAGYQRLRAMLRPADSWQPGHRREA